MYKIGDIVYIVRNKRYNDKLENEFTTKYDTKVVIDKFEVEYILLDEVGVHILINTRDGYIRLDSHYYLILDRVEKCKVFKTVGGASNYLETIIDS